MSDFKLGVLGVFIFFFAMFIIAIGLPWAFTEMGPIWNSWGNKDQLSEYFQDVSACDQAHDHLYFCKDLKQ
jgi:hypothetical protein